MFAKVYGMHVCASLISSHIMIIINNQLCMTPPTATPPHTQDVDRSGLRSPSPNFTPSLLKSVLLGNEIEDDLGPQNRVRVSSISGRPVRQDGVGIVIGDESSSESEDEGDDTHKWLR